MEEDHRRTHKSNRTSGEHSQPDPAKQNYGEIPKIVIHPPSGKAEVLDAWNFPVLDHSPPVISPIGSIIPAADSVRTSEDNDKRPRPRTPLRRHSIQSFDQQTSIQFTPGVQRETGASSPEGSTKQIPSPAEAVFVSEAPQGWTMKTRTIHRPEFPRKKHNVDIVVVYIYSHSQCLRDGADGDIAFLASNAEIRNTPLPKRASTTAPNPTNSNSKSSPRRKEEFFKSAVEDISYFELGSPETKDRHLNWLNRTDMLPKHFPASRVTTIGFDIGSKLSAPLDFTAAGDQLLRYIEEIRKDFRDPPTPILFLGHSYGGLFIIECLNRSKSLLGPDCIHKHTAGVFLTSCSNLASSRSTKLVASFLNEKSDAKVFEDMATGMATLDALSQTFRKNIIERASKGKNSDRYNKFDDETAGADTPSVEIGFPVTEFITLSEQASENRRDDFLKLSSPKVVLQRDFQDALRFSSPWDNDFLRIVLLMDASFRTGTFLHAVLAGRYKDARKMIKSVFNLNVQDRWGQSALHIAVRRDDESIVRLLLSTGRVDPNIRDEALNTPLHYAVENNNATIVKELLAAGADINLRNSSKLAPKDMATSSSSSSRVVHLLRSRLVEGPEQSLISARISNGNQPSSPEEILACRNYQISVSEIFRSGKTDKHWTISVSVQQLLYSESTLEDILATVRPEAVSGETPFCTWIHVPENNMIWVEDLFAKLNLHKSIWQGKAGSTSDSLRNRAIVPHVVKGSVNSIFIPFISYEINARQERRSQYAMTVNEEFEQERLTRTMIEQHALAGSLETTTSPSPLVSSDSDTLLNVPEVDRKSVYPKVEACNDKEVDTALCGIEADPHELDEEERGLIKAYLHNPASLHMRRTLDQYYYHMLESTRERDADQVVSRWALNVKKTQIHNILMVDQLWLWITREENDKFDYIVSCFPGRVGVGQSLHPSIDDLWSSVLVPGIGRRDPICKTEELVSRVLETCFDSFGKLHGSDMLRFFNMFEDSIGAVDAEETILFQAFQKGSEARHNLQKHSKHFEQEKEVLLEQVLDIRKETRLLVEIKDIRDEINIILSVLHTQQTVMGQMRSNEQSPGDLISGYTVERLVEGTIRDFTKLDSQAKTVQDKLHTLMDLKQKAANAWEAREAREYAIEAGRQGNTMLVFTIVTIIFLPLSFTSSFFALGIAAFPKDRATGQTNWPLGQVSKYIFGISLTMSFILVIFALHMRQLTALWKEVRNNHAPALALKLLAFFPTSWHMVSDWSRRLERHRESYLPPTVPTATSGQNGAQSNDAGISFSTQSTFQVPALFEAQASGIEKSTGGSLFSRFRLHRTGSGMCRKYADEEALKGY